MRGRTTGVCVRGALAVEPARPQRIQEWVDTRGYPHFSSPGGNRIGDNLFANCVIALDARTGKRVWHFQSVKHDTWDYDFPAAPSLVTVTRDGRKIEAVAQITKTGFVYVFNRRTGESLRIRL